MARFDKVRYANGAIPTADIRLEMQKIMQSDAAVFRTESSLQDGVKKIDAVNMKLKDMKVSDRSLIW